MRHRPAHHSARPAQILARLAGHDMPLSSLPADFFCIIMHQSLLAAVDCTDRRGGGGGGGGGGRRVVDVVPSPSPSPSCIASPMEKFMHLPKFTRFPAALFVRGRCFRSGYGRSLQGRTLLLLL